MDRPGIQFSGKRARLVALPLFILAVFWATPALAGGVLTDPEPDLACPADYGTGWITQYSTTVETPADSTDWWVSVEFTITGEGASCALTLATYELPSGTFEFPQSLFDAESGTFGSGTHTLTASLPLEEQHPGCWAQYDFVFGPAIDELTFDNRYEDRQVRSRIVGSDECGEDQVGGTMTPIPTATPSSAAPTPREDTEGGNPTPGAGNLPDTSMAPVSTGSATGLLALVLALSVSALAFAAQRARRS